MFNTIEVLIEMLVKQGLLMKTIHTEHWIYEASLVGSTGTLFQNDSAEINKMDEIVPTQRKYGSFKSIDVGARVGCE